MREFLAHVRSGCNLSEACREVGIDRDNKLKVLRRRYKDFDAQLKELRWGAGRTTTSAGKDKTAYLRTPEREWGTEFEDARVESFLLTLRETGDRDAAARASGFLPSTVMAMLDPTDEKFNAGFSQAMREEELRALWSIEDDLWRSARKGDGVSSRFVLERRHGDYGQRAQSSTSANDSKFNSETLLETMKTMRELMAEIRSQAGRANSVGTQTEPTPVTTGGEDGQAN